MFYIVNEGATSYSQDAVIYRNEEKRYCEKYLKEGQIIATLSSQGGRKVFVAA